MALTEKQQAYIVRHFKNTKNDILMQKLGISHSALHRFAQEQGLKKNKTISGKMPAGGIAKSEGGKQP